jgi:hypothetical protein
MEPYPGRPACLIPKHRNREMWDRRLPVSALGIGFRMESTPMPKHERNDGSLELFTVSLVGTLAIAAAVLVGVSWKHLRARTVAPADAPIVVE